MAHTATAKRTRAPRVATPPALPASHLNLIEKMELRTVCYRNVAVATNADRSEWLPRDIIGKDGNTLIVWRKADEVYSFDGYQPWHNGMFGGRSESILNALAWVQRAFDIKAGKEWHF